MESDFIVFVVDDDEAVRDSLGLLLSAHGFEVADFSSAVAFLDSDTHATPGCLVLDYHMPDMTGLDLLEKLQRLGAVRPTIMISGLANAAIRQRAATAGVKFFLEKPLRQDLLIETVKRIWRESESAANDGFAGRAIAGSTPPATSNR